MINVRPLNQLYISDIPEAIVNCKFFSNCKFFFFVKKMLTSVKI